jgi:hemerythrin
MAYMVWSNTLDTGIDVIDGQHKRIVEMINQLTVSAASHQREVVGEVIDGLVDYTLSHFAFEESLMEEAGYEFIRPHKKVHELFVRRVSEYQMRFHAGEDVHDELTSLLSRWLFNHIRNDDAGYVSSVMPLLQQSQPTGKTPRRGLISGLFDRLFG